MRIKRSFVIGALLFLQVLFLFLAILNINSRTLLFYSGIQAINLVMVVLLGSSRANPTYRLAWVVVVMIFPVFGVLLYLFAGTNITSQRMRRRLQRAQEINREVRYQGPRVMEALRRQNPSGALQAQYILTASARPVCQGTRARLLTPGEEMYAAMLTALREARRFILLEYFIIAQGKMWDGILTILKQKVAAGVEVKIIYDDLGSIDHLPGTFIRDLRAAGIEVLRFNPFMPVLNHFMNYRDHRKITVIDGNIGFVGGINIGDEYINVTKPHGYWKDTSVVLRGEAVWSLTLMFLDMWKVISNAPIQYDRYLPTLRVPDNGFVQPYDDSPADENDVSEGVYMQMINRARRYVYITTPYLIIGSEMMTALCLAGQSGVDVRIITPHVPDKWYVHCVTRSFYGRLMESGVKIYEYLPGFIHAKTCVCDDEFGVVGSVNFDYRSFFLQFENAVWFCGSDVVGELKEDFRTTVRHSKAIDPERWRRRPFFTRLLEMLLNLFSPLM